MNFAIERADTKVIVQAKVLHTLTQDGFSIEGGDFDRPWGGFYLISETETNKFTRTFFPYLKFDPEQKISPKILVVEPGKRLSWQYHQRRAELWKVLVGPVGVYQSLDDQLPDKSSVYEPKELIILSCGTRHRLVGLDEWGVVAEIWQHLDPDKPSTEEDITRLEDDHGRA